MKIAIAHFRIGLTDGVSLQIEERVRILKDLGHSLVFIAGTNSPIGNLRIAYFEYKQHKEIIQIQKQIFQIGTHTARPLSNELLMRLDKIASEIEVELSTFWQKERFSQIFIHNFFSLPVCIPATIAFYRFLKAHPQVRGVAVHHDFWWDPARIDKFRIQNSEFRIFLQKYFPPKLPNLIHTLISKWEQRQLKKIRGIDSLVITDTFDFDRPGWRQNPSNRHFLTDAGIKKGELVILLASRVRRRKGIELGIDFVGELQKEFPNIVLLLPGEYADKEREYVAKLKFRAKQLNVKIRWVKDMVGSVEEQKRGLKKYCLWDCYVFADAIIYPSVWEGLGNQFLEAVFAQKPLIVFEYPVYITDLKPAGFEVVSLGQKVSLGADGLANIPAKRIRDAGKRLGQILADPKAGKSIVKANFALGKLYYNTNTKLLNHFKKLFLTVKNT